MKNKCLNRTGRVVIYTAFTLFDGLFFSLGAACALKLFGIAMAVSLDGKGVTEMYPRFIPFCLSAGLLMLGILIFSLILKLKHLERLGYTIRGLALGYFISLVLSLPLLKIWETVFDFLQKTL